MQREHEAFDSAIKSGGDAPMVLTEEETEFLLGHPGDCPLDIHSFEAIDRVEGWPKGTLRNWDGRSPLPPSDPEQRRIRTFRLIYHLFDRRDVDAALGWPGGTFTKWDLHSPLPAYRLEDLEKFEKKICDALRAEGGK